MEHHHHHNEENNHHHTHEHDHYHHHVGHSHIESSSNLLGAFLLNLVFTIIEIMGGLFTNSIAILSDAVHDFGDTIAIGTAYFLEKKSFKSRDEKYSYGYRRLSPFAALINLVILSSGSIIIFVESIPRLINPQAVKSQEMIYFAIAGIIFNGLALLKLINNKNNTNVKTVFLHLLEDVLGWIGVLIGAIVIHFTGYYIIDPLLSILISLYIFYNAIKNLKYILPIFLQAVPKNTNQAEINAKLKEITNVIEVHDLHTWTLDGEYNVVTVHLVVSDELGVNEISQIKKEAREILQNNKQEHYTIEIEFLSEICDFKDC